MSALADATFPDAEALRDRVLVVPVGATEQHGPHLPLTTDADIAQALAGRLAATGAPVVVAPVVAYGSSGEHQAFAGTLSIGAAATQQLLIELGRSATETWRRILLLSTHGGNAVPVSSAVARLREEGRDVRAWSPRWEGDAHAGHTETSVMLALAPERVRRAGAVAGAREPIAGLLGRLRAGGIAAVSANGVLGDATTADAADGRRLLEQATTELVAFLEAWPA